MKLDQIGPEKVIWCLEVPFFQSLPGINGLSCNACTVHVH